MMRFFLILLLAAVALSQVVPRLGFNQKGNAAEFGILCDESENEKTDKPDFKTQGEDKLHQDNPHLYNFSTILSITLTPGAQSLYISFYDQPKTPPPNFF